MSDATVTNDPERDVNYRAIARLRAGIMAVTIGMVSGVSLFVATVWLVVRGGPNVGEHLGLLRNYFPGYSVTWLGAFVGFFWAAVLGAAVGGGIAWLYNLAVVKRHGPPA